MQEKIKKISRALRYLVLIMTTWITLRFVYELVIDNHLLLSVAPDMMDNLWQNPATNKMILLMYSLPSMCFIILVAYWLQRLFSLFQQGQYFSNSNMYCFLWLVWLNFISSAYSFFGSILLGYYGNNFDVDIKPMATFEVIDFFTMLLLVVIVYVLKAARELEQENQEFV